MAGEIIVVQANANRIEAVTPIDRSAGIYLYTARNSDLLALSQGKRAENIVRAYEVLTRRARVLQLRFNVALFVASLALVGLAVWFALRFADRQVKPLYELVDAAAERRQRQFRAAGRGSHRRRRDRPAQPRLQPHDRADRTPDPGAGRRQRQLEERRAFIEAVLESVTAGIVSLDATGRSS